MKTLFTPVLAPKNAAISGGFSSGGHLSTPCIADKVFGGVVSGPWLTCYMIRRFGWPNSGSDDHKDLCAWTLTTPIDGLYLQVAPYLGGSNLHFAVRFNDAIRGRLMADPGRDAFALRQTAAIRRWWSTSGKKAYVFGVGRKEGDRDELISVYAEIPNKPGYVAGLWRRTRLHKKNRDNIPPLSGMMVWWLCQFLREKHPGVSLPIMSKREKARRVSRFGQQAHRALEVTMRDLLRPTNVRDLSYTPFGDIERTPEAMKRFTNQKHGGVFPGAGYAPEYWFGPKCRKGQVVAK